MNLLPLYVGPYKVLKRDDKFFLLAVGGQEETVSIDCLKCTWVWALSQRPSLPPAAGLHPQLLWCLSLSSLRQPSLAGGHAAFF
jgi:hypothetical protein